MARSFDRSTSDAITYAHYPAFDGAAQVALSMWIYPVTSVNYDQWIGQIDGTNSNGFSLNHRTTVAGRVFVAMRNGSSTPAGYTTSTTALTVNQWNHLVVQFDGTQGTAANRVTVYVNGVAFALTLAGTWPTTLGTITDPLKLASTWTGRLAGVAAWTGVVLSPSEIAELANRRAPDVVRKSGLVFYADLRTTPDDSVGRVPGTVAGTTLIDHPASIIRPLAPKRVYVPVGGGSYSLTQSAAGAYTVTGQTATLTKASALAPDAGSYTVAGNTTTLTVARILTCDAGSYTLTGNAVTLTKASVLLPAAGAYTLTGNDAALTYQQAGSLTCDVGTYTVTGFDTTLTVARLLTANTGDYTTTGLDVTFTVGTTLICDSGNYTVTGFDPTLLYIRSLPATTGAYTVTGQAVTLLYSGAPVEDTDYSEYIFGQGSDPISTLSIDLLPNDDGVSSLSISLGD